jgi:hypothetical protein
MYSRTARPTFLQATTKLRFFVYGKVPFKREQHSKGKTQGIKADTD